MKWFVFLLMPIGLFSQQVSQGKLETIHGLDCKGLDDRKVWVWLPNDYSSDQKYDVLYMHDGQMLFDSLITWNHQEWKVDEVMQNLINQRKIRPTIVVAIAHNDSKRISEYFPHKPWKLLSDSLTISLFEKYKVHPIINGDGYLDCIVHQLKPYIDKKYSVNTGPEHTFMMGSSMGGIISLYAWAEYPEVFGGIASLSTAWLNFVSDEIPKSFVQYWKNKPLQPKPYSKIYMDYGTEEADEDYLKTQQQMEELILETGFRPYQNFVSQENTGGEHNEKSWSTHMHKALQFLLSNDQKPTTGTIEKYHLFHSKHVTDRNVEVWLPNHYDGKKKFSVLYMHDGQMLFDANTTWNQQAWKADSIADKLMKQKDFKDFIIVGIWNGGETRHKDYFPQEPFESLSDKEKVFVTQQLKNVGRIDEDFQPISDKYLKFIVEELKPFIDTNYVVKKDVENTFIMGSSMGGLISMYALTQYPNVFGGAACLSTHWPGIFEMKDNPIPEAFYSYLEKYLPTVKNRKLYFDIGNETLDALYPPLQSKVNEIMKEVKPKYSLSPDGAKIEWKDNLWHSEFFKGANHSEEAWQKRLMIPMGFLMKSE